ncbi:GNAT family N-acetyltransferase [Weissella paramesenteroides]|uniref:GNAT family N-acetyltransferase n=1 Tax=Weissella paramesenteroides TaxID=1249 RepID=UPI0020734F81|nr:GNAT family N-acetyltransferase [Weissella paramesenteroides]MCM6764842.1 GNAT family N-acetyltransferase [Weissella paramesenteroides]MCM6768048.1 GNAT family N-acetyltransferase [Weissella paramesenteroides]MCM6768696.1 GNAT family N-acetyltransferase [Weissella paramesenteroides]MCM6770781.1 GNAT family N-acetyltransferase [Weissella paramesenteroides]MCM6780702.1 GNAT family N-acetyltransferase [Weissella paramesenteroides]
MITIRPIQKSDDPYLKKLVQNSLKAYQLDIPGTAYFDPELAHLSDFYRLKAGRQYFVAINNFQEVVGGAGIAEYDVQNKVAELQKLYIDKKAQGHHLSYQLLDQALRFAKEFGYQQVYLETHHNLETAIHVYKTYGFTELTKPLKEAEHSEMDHFFVMSV